MPSRSLASKKLGKDEEFAFDASTTGVRITVEWISSLNEICDLDIHLLIYDNKARFIQKLNADFPVSSDNSCTLAADIDSHKAGKSSHEENCHISFPTVDERVSSMLLFVDGGPRNFQFVQRLVLHCWKENIDYDETNFMNTIDQSNIIKVPLFYTQCRVRKDFEGLAHFVLYKKELADASIVWVCKPVYHPVFESGVHEKDDHCNTNIVHIVPALHKYRPRLFPSVKHICSALSSTSLPSLKKRFSKGKGLELRLFTEVLFYQLWKTCPSVLEPDEASYTVAMLHDLFGQIDYNGDGHVDWDEFTTFCIYTGLVGGASDGYGSASLNSYVIEYVEDFDLVDTVMTNHAPITSLKHVPELKRLLALQDKDNGVNIFDENFTKISYLDPGNVVGHDGKVAIQHPSQQPLKVMDVQYVPYKDMFVYSASDHTINFCREHITNGRKRVHYSLYNRIDHAYLQVKLCWSEHSKILCSVDQENIIYGWEIDSKAPIFQLSRHKDKITDFLALDKHNLFATCSLDKRIVLWSQTTRRVKGVLQGHQRGIKVMSYAKDTLLSAGFECEATAWDLNLYEPSFYLRGHRLPLSAVKLMSQPDQQDENLRAITVDDGGEFRLWNIFVREKGSGVQLAETLQTFNQSHISDKSLCKIQFLVVPYNAMFSKEKYSDVIAASNRMIHFKPQKIAMDFFPPVCMSYSDPNACVVTAVGKSLFKYDITSGCYHSALSDIDTSEVTFFLLEGEHNRRIYVGTANGYLYLINFASGQVIGKVRAHGKDLMALTILNKKKDAHSDPDTLLYSGSTDGNIRQITECSGNLEITHTIENAMGNHRRINFMESVQEFKVLFCFALRRWAIFNLTTMKRNFLFNEKDEITGFEFLGGGGRYDKMDVKDYDEAIRIESERIVTLVVCTTTQLKVYAVDVTQFKAVLTHVLGHSHSLHFSKVCKIRFPKKESVNYISVKKKSLSLCLVAGSDEGDLTLWDAKIIRLESLKVYYQTVPEFLAQLSIKAPKMKPNKAKASTLMRAASLLRRGKGTSSFGFKKKSDRQSSYSVSSSSSITQKEFVGLEKMNEFSNISNDGDTIVKDEIESVSAIKSNAPHLRHRNAMIHSLSKPMYKVSEVPQNDEDALSQVSVTSIESFSGVDADRDARKMKLAIGQSSMALIEEMDTSDDYRLSELTGNEKDAVYIPSHMSFKAHTDVIHNVEPLPEHGCIVSSSQDGYHRVWNLLGDCLGEMPLPNITDKMKKDPGRYTDVWKFVAEKIPVSKAHIAFSKLIVKNIEEGLYDEQVFVERRKAIDAGLIALKKSKSEKIMMQIKSSSDETRVRMLGDLAYGPSEASHSSINSMKKGAGALLKQASNRFDEDDDGSMCSDNSSLTPTLAHTAGSTLFSNLDVGCRDEKKKLKKKDIDAYDSVFDSEDLWNPISKVLGKCSVAFSDSSIATAHTQGLFDEDAHRMLAEVNTDKNKVDVYERAEPSVMLRNLSMTASSSSFPSQNVSFTEVKFGKQKDMYKNANRVIANKTRFMKNMTARHSIASLRLKQNVSKIGKTIDTQKVSAHEEIMLPALDTEATPELSQPVALLSRSRSSVRRQASFGLSDGSSRSEIKRQPSGAGGDEPKRMLNHEKLIATMNKVITAEKESIPEWEKRRRAAMAANSKSNGKNKTQISILLLERKLATVIKSLHKEVDNRGHGERLTNRMLLPHYKLSDLKNFLHIFQSVDEDYSGDLDVDEWIKFFNEMNKSFSPQQARMMFNKVDQNGDGYLSVSDLVPVIFNNATGEQKLHILKFLELELSKRKLVGNDFTTDEELEMLFEHYDTKFVGFIKISVIREKVKSFALPDAAHVAVMSLLNEHDDDEMVNFSEFRRIFQNYMAIV